MSVIRRLIQQAEDELTPTQRQQALLLRQRLDLAANVIQLRKARGLTQEKLAEAAGVKQSHISRIENARGNPSHDILIKIADALNSELILQPLQHKERTSGLEPIPHH